MLGKYTGGSGSPIEARQTAPILTIIICLLAITALLVLLYILVKKISTYKNSDAYKQKEINRKTKYNDVVKFSKENNLSPSETKILWEIINITNALNINYSLKTNSDVNNLFKDAYLKVKSKNFFNDQKLNDFFSCLYKIEMVVAQFKKLTSSRQIPEESIIFYIADSGEQYPFTIKKNTKDFFIAEIPDFMMEQHRKPKTLVRSRFTFKTNDGLSYNLISRIIRFETNSENKNFLIIAHTDQLECQTQRHYKREFFQEICLFAPVKVEKSENNKATYQESSKKYKGKITNISAGGCCINTTLPIKENQYIGVTLPEHGIENIIGIIKRTRKLPNGSYALHIQFVEISLKTKNQVYCLVYKYEM